MEVFCKEKSHKSRIDNQIKICKIVITQITNSMEKIYEYLLTYFGIAYVLLFVWRCQQVYRYLQSFPSYLQRDFTIEEFIGRKREDVFYWCLPILPVVGSAMLGLIIVFIWIFLVYVFAKLFWDFISGKWTYGSKTN